MRVMEVATEWRQRNGCDDLEMVVLVVVNGRPAEGCLLRRRCVVKGVEPWSLSPVICCKELVSGREWLDLPNVELEVVDFEFLSMS